MKSFQKAIEKVEFELPVFLILAMKLPFEQLKTYWFSYLILSFAAAWLLGEIIRRTEKNMKIYCLFFIAFLLSGDMMKSLFMPAVTFSYILYGKAASFLCFLLAVLIIRSPAPLFQRPVFTRYLPFLCAAGIILGPSFAFFFIPIVLILLLFEGCKTGKTGLDSVFWMVLLGSLLISAAFIVSGYLSDFRYMGVVPLKVAFKIITWGELFKAAAAVLPLIAMFALLWADAYKKALDKRLKRIILVCMTEPLLVILINILFYYTASDGWQYTIFIIVFTQFCLLFYFLDSGEKTVAGSAGKIGGFLKKNLLVLMAVIVYLIKFADIVYSR